MTRGRALAIAAILLVIVLVGASLLADIGKLSRVAVDYPWWRLGPACALVLGNYALRTVRFRTYLRAVDVVVSWREAALVFVAGFLFTAALAGAAALKQSLTLRGVARSVAFITQAQASNIDTDSSGQIAPTASLPNAHATADTLVYYMGRKDAVSIAQELIAQGRSMNTPVHLLESVSTPREHIYTTTLAELADNRTESWFNSDSPLLIMIGEALRNRQASQAQIQAADAVLNCSATEIDNGLQDLRIFADSRRSA